MPNHSTADHVSALRLTTEKSREFRKDHHLHIAFIDLKAAFDTVNYASLWKTLQLLGAPPKITTLFYKLYNNADKLSGVIITLPTCSMQIIPLCSVTQSIS